jgi:ABC-type antimicrobial peptide transport system permease subunit
VQRIGALEKAAELELSEATARTLSGMLEGAGAYEAKLRDPLQAEALARAARTSLGAEYRVQTWRELNAPLAFALRLEKSVIFVTVALVILVAALNIVSNIALTVVEKKRDLGVFTAMGARPSSLERIYLTLGGVIGVIGTVAGVFGRTLVLLTASTGAAAGRRLPAVARAVRDPSARSRHAALPSRRRLPPVLRRAAARLAPARR